MYVPEGMTEVGQTDRRNRVGVWRRYIRVGRRYVRANRRYVGVGRRDVGAKRRCIGASRRYVRVGMDVTCCGKGCSLEATSQVYQLSIINKVNVTVS